MTLELDIRARNGVHIFGRSRYIMLPRSKGNSVRVTEVSAEGILRCCMVVLGDFIEAEED